MSFGGSVQGMITTIKNNEKMRRNKRKHFQKRLGGNESIIKTEYNLPNASQKQLEDIKKRLQEERRLWWLKLIILTLIGIIGFIILFYYVILE